ncbi:hypothetical protein ACVGVM_23710 [Pseudonocardia bannensis]|uniref:Uncharacterized protein n=1 Tax=Pseudonocardia bannensis TaxID=630973 RepID=A0A848DM45_9PSEU|nr:hypothetical protein [Pseudonocardia bannensis]NMH93798.1 hypothetical protein [Pseudonocardia bannensis]
MAEVQVSGWRELVAESGAPRPHASRRTDVVTTVLSVWFVLGLFLDAYAHANVPQLESFFTPWHAVFYSGFAATGGWVLWTVYRNSEQGRRGISAVPLGYGMTMVALPVFAVSGAADMAWHTIFGVETTTDIFFSPSHLGLIASMIVILTSPFRSAWSNPALGARPSLRALAPAVWTLAFAATLVLLFLTYGNALLFGPQGIVSAFSDPEGRASTLAVRMVVTNLVLLVPLLVIARRWHLPFGVATISYAPAVVLSGLLTGFHNLPTMGALAAAAVLVDLLGRWLRPTAERRTAYWAFATGASLITWTIYLGVAAGFAGRLPSVAAMWTGAPVVAALLGWVLAALLLPNAAPPSRREGSFPG